MPTIQEEFDALEHGEELETLYQRTLNSHLLDEDFTAQTTAIEQLEINSPERTQAQKDLLIKLEHKIINAKYQQAVRNGEILLLPRESKDVDKQKQRLMTAKILNPGLAINTECDESVRIFQVQKITGEILSTEETYNKQLNHLLSHFLRALPSQDIRDPQITQFLDKLKVLKEIAELSDIIVEQLREASKITNADNRAQAMAMILEKNAPQMEALYAQYVPIHDELDPNKSEIIANLMKIPKFAQFHESFKKLKGSTPPMTPGGMPPGPLNLASFLILPVQRLPRCILLLGELKKKLPPKSPVKNPITTAIEALTTTTLSVNEAVRARDPALAQARSFDLFDGFHIKVTNIKPENPAATIDLLKKTMTQNGYVCGEPEQRKAKSKHDRQKVTIYDEHHRAIFKIKYGHDSSGHEHMSIHCGKKEIKRFASDNIRYKAEEVMGDLNSISATPVTPETLAEKQFRALEILRTEFPGCSFKIEPRQSDPTKLKIKVYDANNKEILVLRGEERGFKIEKARDPNKQFFDPLEMHEQAMKASSIAMHASHYTTGKNPNYNITIGTTFDSIRERIMAYKQELTADLSTRLAAHWGSEASLPRVQARHTAIMSPHNETPTPRRGISPVVTPLPSVRKTIAHAKPLVHDSTPLHQVASQRPQPTKLKTSSPPKLKSSLQLKMPPEMAEPPKILSSASPLPQARTISSQKQIESRTHIEPPTRSPLRLSTPKAPVRLGEISSREDIERLRASLRVLRNPKLIEKISKKLVQALIHAPFPLSSRDLTSLSKPEDKQSRAEWLATYIEANKSNPRIDKETIAGLRREIVEIHKSKDEPPPRNPKPPSPRRGDLRA